MKEEESKEEDKRRRGGGGGEIFLIFSRDLSLYLFMSTLEFCVSLCCTCVDLYVCVSVRDALIFSQVAVSAQQWLCAVVQFVVDLALCFYFW